MYDPNLPKATSDDILAALYSLMAVVEALEEWHRPDEPIEPAEFDGEEEAAKVA